VEPLHDYVHQGRGYRTGVGWCRVRIYASPTNRPADAPVVLCTDLFGGEGGTDVAPFLAAEVVRERFGGGLPELPRPMLWIEHHPPRRRGPGRYYLLDFPFYEPRPAGAGFVRRLTLGEPDREPLSPAEVAALIGEGAA